MSDIETTTDAEKAAVLAAAGKKAEAQKKERQERVVKGSHLLEQLKNKAAEPTLNLKTEEMSGFVKVTGSTKGKRILIAKKGGRVDLSGFTIEADAVKQISEQEARDKHLGKVRAQLDFGRSDDEVLAAFGQALSELNVAFPEKEKPAKKSAEPKAEATTETKAEA